MMIWRATLPQSRSQRIVGATLRGRPRPNPGTANLPIRNPSRIISRHRVIPNSIGNPVQGEDEFLPTQE